MSIAEIAVGACIVPFAIVLVFNVGRVSDRIADVLDLVSPTSRNPKPDEIRYRVFVRVLGIVLLLLGILAIIKGADS